MDDAELLAWLDELLIALHSTYDQVHADSSKLIGLLDELDCFRHEFHQRTYAREGAPWMPRRGG